MTQPIDAGACVVDTMVLSALLDTRTPGRGRPLPGDPRGAGDRRLVHLGR